MHVHRAREDHSEDVGASGGHRDIAVALGSKECAAIAIAIEIDSSERSV